MTDQNGFKEVDLFWQISQTMVSKKYLQEILQIIVNTTAKVMNSKICSLMLYDEEKGELKIVATQALGRDYLEKANLKVDESVSGQVVKKKEPIIIRDVRKEEGFRFRNIAINEGLVSLLSVPMNWGERVIGVINSYTNAEHDFSEREIKTLQSVANQAAVAIENTDLRKQYHAAKQALESRKYIDRAKSILMEKDGIKENEAYRLIQKTSRDNKKPMVEVAQAILLAYSIK